jgi:hypothetical protein
LRKRRKKVDKEEELLAQRGSGRRLQGILQAMVMELDERHQS